MASLYEFVHSSTALEDLEIKVLENGGRRCCFVSFEANIRVAKGQGLDCAILVIRPFSVLRVTEFEGCLFLIEVEDICDNDTRRSDKGKNASACPCGQSGCA
jgi:hypothetical protein